MSQVFIPRLSMMRFAVFLKNPLEDLAHFLSKRAIYMFEFSGEISTPTMHFAKFGNQKRTFLTHPVNLCPLLLTATNPAYLTNCTFNAVFWLSEQYLSK